MRGCIQGAAVVRGFILPADPRFGQQFSGSFSGLPSHSGAAVETVIVLFKARFSCLNGVVLHSHSAKIVIMPTVLRQQLVPPHKRRPRRCRRQGPDWESRSSPQTAGSKSSPGLISRNILRLQVDPNGFCMLCGADRMCALSGCSLDRRGWYDVCFTLFGIGFSARGSRWSRKPRSSSLRTNATSPP